MSSKRSWYLVPSVQKSENKGNVCGTSSSGENQRKEEKIGKLITAPQKDDDAGQATEEEAEADNKTTEAPASSSKLGTCVTYCIIF
ncbi:hypothetical protein KM043_016767 [Ampulex compressa]|nr:hypothetical protein KM043_016767 [Ampulex compressa]